MKKGDFGFFNAPPPLKKYKKTNKQKQLFFLNYHFILHETKKVCAFVNFSTIAHTQTCRRNL